MAATRASSIVPVKKAECITSFETSGFENEEISKYMNTTRSIAANTAKAIIRGLFFMFSVLLWVMFKFITNYRHSNTEPRAELVLVVDDMFPMR